LVPPARPGSGQRSLRFFQIIKADEHKLGLKTIATMVDDGAATPNKSDGAGAQQQEDRLTVVYDKTQSPTTTGFSLIIRAIQATNPEIVYLPSTCRTESA